jgi:hypothetical protein
MIDRKVLKLSKMNGEEISRIYNADAVYYSDEIGCNQVFDKTRNRHINIVLSSLFPHSTNFFRHWPDNFFIYEPPYLNYGPETHPFGTNDTRLLALIHKGRYVIHSLEDVDLLKINKDFDIIGPRNKSIINNLISKIASQYKSLNPKL